MIRKYINIFKFRQFFSSCIEDVRFRDVEIILTKHNKPVARIVALDETEIEEKTEKS